MSESAGGAVRTPPTSAARDDPSDARDSGSPTGPPAPPPTITTVGPGGATQTLTVPTTAELDRQHSRALSLGARLLLDRSDDPEEPLRVYADPAGHPFCIFVA